MVHASFVRWRTQAEAALAAFRAREYRKFQGSRKLAFAWLDGLMRTMARGWIAWCAMVARLRIIERVRWQTICALMMQRLWRSFLGRRIVQAAREAMYAERCRRAAAGLQAMWRRRAVRLGVEIDFKVTWSRRWRLHETASPRRRRRGRMNVPRRFPTTSFRAGLEEVPNSGVRVPEGM